MSAAFPHCDGRQRISACVIVKNEAHNLLPCLAPLRRLVDETVVIDTASTDGTAEIARQLGARVDSFASVDQLRGGGEREPAARDR